jgi:hypothetical protein
MSSLLMPNLGETEKDVDAIRLLLQKWQANNNHKGFGQCLSCRYNRQLSDAKFQCGLTGESLSKSETRQICREHEFLFVKQT